MYNEYLETAKKIKSNKEVNGHVMSMPQLSTLIKLTCRYDYVLPIKAMTVKQATEEITRTMKKVDKGEIHERAKMYKYTVLMNAFKEKHSEVYNAVLNR